MGEMIRLPVSDDMAAWLQTKAQERHGGDVAAFITELLALEQDRDSRRLTPEQMREAARKYSEWQANLPADVLEDLAGFVEARGRSALNRAAELRERAADAAGRP